MAIIHALHCCRCGQAFYPVSTYHWRHGDTRCIWCASDPITKAEWTKLFPPTPISTTDHVTEWPDDWRRIGLEGT